MKQRWEQYVQLKLSANIPRERINLTASYVNVPDRETIPIRPGL